MFPSDTRFIFQWNDPYGSVSGPPGAQRDLRLFVVDQAGNFLGSTGAIELGGDPIIDLPVAPDLPVTPGQYGFAFGLCGGSTSPPPYMKYMGFRSTIEILDFATDSSTSFGHPNMPFTAGVGASFFQETPEFGISPPVLETFSSAGGTPIFFDEDGTRKATPEVRQQPRFVGVDRTSNTFFGEPGTPFNFAGK